MPYRLLFPALFILLSCFVLSCDSDGSNTRTVQKGHALTLSFEGPMTSEDAEVNPFLNYLLFVEFEHEEHQETIRGFYAADGNAAETSATSGNTWQVRFSPGHPGIWTYNATLFKGDSVSVKQRQDEADQIEITNSQGTFEVLSNGDSDRDFHDRGKLIASNGYLQFEDSGTYFLKAGSDSPENFLAFQGFDDTYRIAASDKEGEAQTDSEIHSYEPHIQDWNPGDPTWQDGKGKGIIGAVNYLASKGMNAVYFLTLNIQGDGKDVWMFTTPEDFTRFDVSKLDQWEILFQHMQAKGILLHVVLQETENETLLDGGDMGPVRTLYFHELIARFGHHPALIWNLGEENGLAPWVTTGAQTDRQRKEMATFFKENDPYNHPVVIHTLPNEELRAPVLDSLLGFPHLDGISLQHHERTTAPETVERLKEQSKQSGHEWMVTMDEIGMWHTGAKVDTADISHPTLTRYALWGTLLSGAAGVEWYFGARSPHNDLTSEDWRQRDRLWEITNHAKAFFEEYLPYWEMEPTHHLVNAEGAYCLSKTDSLYALYIPDFTEAGLDLTDATGQYQIRWFNPFEGGPLQEGSVDQISGGNQQSLGVPPSRLNEDWVLLVEKIE
ncbi:DUF5060 domain-containing protein [Rhodohalobacter sulfatireducens]|nr:DUF5060 domain-containing protein [Rhodohalobacter sulfatireducens]